MCAEIELIPIPEWAAFNLEHFDPGHPEYGLDGEGRRCFQIDRCIAPALLAVWAAGFQTLGCCCGHGQDWGVISLDLGLFDGARDRLPPTEHHCSFCGGLHEPQAAP